MTVEIDYAPRPQQRVCHKGLWAHRFGVVVTHRRFGKTVMAANHLIRGALTCRLERPRFAYIAPTFRQGKQICWDYLQHYSATIPDTTPNQSELRIDYPNTGQVRIFGADNPDSLRGLYFDGVILDEFGLMAPNTFSEVVRPCLSDRNGWAAFLGTPNGKNQFYDVASLAQRDPSWFYAVYKASDTGILSEQELADARKVMTDDEYRQEYECSFEASIRGAIYATELAKLEHDQRMTHVPYDPLVPVDTAWDLGVGDNTAIWFSQSLRSGEVRLIDYYETSGEGLPHFLTVLQAKGYHYGRHIGPHDIKVREFSSGKSRWEIAAGLGFKFEVAPNLPLEDGIHAARLMLPKCYFDAEKCRAGLEALKHYQRDYNSRLNELKATPLHNWAEHGASAFRYLAVTQRVISEAPTLTAPLVGVARGPHSWMGY